MSSAKGPAWREAIIRPTWRIRAGSSGGAPGLRVRGRWRGIGQRKLKRLPVVTCRREAGLVVQAVEPVIGEQAELELLGIASHLDRAGLGAWLAPCTRAGSHRGKAPVPFQRDLALEDGMPAGSLRSLLRDTPPITRSSMACQTSAVFGSAKSNNPLIIRWGSPRVRIVVASIDQPRGRR